MTRRLLLGICLTFCFAAAASVPTSGAQGRWKDDGSGGCFFDANDDGPDQCSPGRWKLDASGSCYFDGSDSGPNQCDPQQ
jgi:hypothetical protein